MLSVESNSIVFDGRSYGNGIVTVFHFLFSILTISRFVCLKIVRPKSIVSRVSLRLLLDSRRKHRVLPEVVFWFLFVLMRIIGFVSLYNKKTYAAGQMSYLRIYSMLVGSSYSFHRNIFFFKTVFSYFCRRSRFLSTYWFRFFNSHGSIYNFAFKDISFDERFYRLINAAPFYWSDFKAILSITSEASLLLYAVFMFREFLKIPLENLRLRDKGVDFWTKELKRLDRKKFLFRRFKKKK